MESEVAADERPVESKLTDLLSEESTLQVPEFMMNDLKGASFVRPEETRTTRLGRIRNSLYFLTARALKFGFD